MGEGHRRRLGAERQTHEQSHKLWQQGKARHAEACSMCHAAPKADHFTANQWASVLPAKGGRTGHTRAGANAVMFKYLQAHAKK